MARITFSIGLALLMVFGLVIWLSPNPILAAEVPKQTPDKVLNSEGDEWLEANPQQSAPIPPAPELASQNEIELHPLVVPEAVVPGPEARCWG